MEEEPRLDNRPRWPVGEVTDEEEEEEVVVVVVVLVEEEEVVEELKSTCLLSKEPLPEKHRRRRLTSVDRQMEGVCPNRIT